MKQIVVIGSINMDIVNRVRQHPLPGETIKGLKTEFNPGGKGANQAVAAARAGGKVSMAGAVGNDLFGQELAASLSREGVNTDYVFKKDVKSGLAFITVNQEGENSIILTEGANGELRKNDILSLLEKSRSDDTVLVLQNEIPWETTSFIIEEAAKSGIDVYLNPAPAEQVPNHILRGLTGLFVNETETEVITGLPVTDNNSAKLAATVLLEAGVEEVILTLGANGSYFANQSGVMIFTPAHPFKAIDTTAAGDTFIGSYIVAKTSGESPGSSLRFATAAAGLAVVKEGAQPSIPYLEDIRAAMKEL